MDNSTTDDFVICVHCGETVVFFKRTQVWRHIEIGTGKTYVRCRCNAVPACVLESVGD